MKNIKQGKKQVFQVKLGSRSKKYGEYYNFTSLVLSLLVGIYLMYRSINSLDILSKVPDGLYNIRMLWSSLFLFLSFMGGIGIELFLITGFQVVRLFIAFFSVALGIMPLYAFSSNLMLIGRKFDGTSGRYIPSLWKAYY